MFLATSLHSMEDPVGHCQYSLGLKTSTVDPYIDCFLNRICSVCWTTAFLSLQRDGKDRPLVSSGESWFLITAPCPFTAREPGPRPKQPLPAKAARQPGSGLLATLVFDPGEECDKAPGNIVIL